MRHQINFFYFKRYKKFIQSRSVVIDRKVQVHNHHIIPESIIKNNNTIALTPREHFIAHKMLVKVFKKNTRNWFKMVKAYGYMIHGHPDLKGIVTSRDYEQYQKEHSAAMKFNNPMFDEKTRKKASENMKKSWTPERRAAQAERSRNRKQTGQAKEKLSVMWKGVPKPKKPGQMEKNIKAQTTGQFITPWGEFDSPGQASRSELNSGQLSRFLVNKYCKDPDKSNFSFIPNGKVETRGLWRKQK